jgi:hypothetical protein
MNGSTGGVAPCVGPGRFDACGRPSVVIKYRLCAGHYKQRKRGKWLVPLRVEFSADWPCNYSQCDRGARRNGYCDAHSTQLKTGGPLRPLPDYRPNGSVTARDSQGRKRCPRCGSWKAAERYYRAAHTVDGLNSCCIDCDRNGKLAKYGITAKQYEELLAGQGGVCAVCQEAPKPGGRRFAVDHDHGCCSGNRSCGKCVRGILCGACNLALGHIRDDPDYVAKLLAYLAAR